VTYFLEEGSVMDNPTWDALKLCKRKGTLLMGKTEAGISEKTRQEGLFKRRKEECPRSNRV